MGERNLVRVRNIVVAAIFDFMTVEDCSSLREVSTCRFREQIERSKKTPALQAMNDEARKSLKAFFYSQNYK